MNAHAQQLHADGRLDPRRLAIASGGGEVR